MKFSISFDEESVKKEIQEKSIEDGIRIFYVDANVSKKSIEKSENRKLYFKKIYGSLKRRKISNDFKYRKPLQRSLTIEGFPRFDCSSFKDHNSPSPESPSKKFFDFSFSLKNKFKKVTFTIPDSDSAFFSKSKISRKPTGPRKKTFDKALSLLNFKLGKLKNPKSVRDEMAGKSSVVYDSSILLKSKSVENITGNSEAARIQKRTLTLLVLFLSF